MVFLIGRLHGNEFIYTLIRTLWCFRNILKAPLGTFFQTVVNTDEDLKYLYDVKSQPATQHLDSRQKKGGGRGV